MSALFTAAMWIHICAGTLAALVLMPIQIIGPKGRLHARVGRITLAVAWVIALSGFGMLANPLFTSFWSQESATLGAGTTNYQTYFSRMTYEPLFFLYLDVILLYLIITGEGVWKRVDRERPDGSIPPRPVDILWNALMAAAALAQMTLGVVDLHTDNGYATSAIHVGIVMLLVVGWDVWTWRDGGRRVRRWWTLHAGKLILAWAGLFFAVMLRWRAQDHVIEHVEAWIVLGWTAVVALSVGTFGWRLHVRRTRAAVTA